MPTPTSPLPKPSPLPEKADQGWAQLKHDLHVRLVQAVNHTALRELDEEQIREQLRQGAIELCRSRPNLLTLAERNRLIEELVDETLGFGPLEKLMRDPEISDILVDGPSKVYVERRGRLEETSVTFPSEVSLLTSLQKILSRVGRRIDEASPMVDARLADGSRINAVIPPLALDGTLVSIRRNVSARLTPHDLVTNGSLSPAMLETLLESVQARANILVSGGTGSGKTTFLNVLSQAIAPEERIVTIEDAAELQLCQPRVARLETRPPNTEGKGEVTTRQLLRNALRMRPERIIVGECRGGEAFDMLQAMNTGHEGSMTTIHANSCHDAIARLEMLVSLSGVNVSPEQILRQIAASIHVVVQVGRYPCGTRKILQIAQTQWSDTGKLRLKTLFVFKPTGVDSAGRICGHFVPGHEEVRHQKLSNMQRPAREDAPRAPQQATLPGSQS